MTIALSVNTQNNHGILTHGNRNEVEQGASSRKESRSRGNDQKTNENAKLTEKQRKEDIQQNFNNRAQSIQVVDTLRLKIGKFVLVNRMSMLNNEISYDMMNISFNSNKIKRKEKFFTN